MLIAIPSDAPGGLEAAVSGHFGHCHAFTLVEVDSGAVKNVSVLPNGGHEQGGCMAPVMFLKQNGVDSLIAGGMGGRPLAGFQQVGISVHYREHAQTVSQAVDLFLDGGCRTFGQAQTCGGGGGGSGSGDGCGNHDHDHAPVQRPALEGPPIVQQDRLVSIDYRLTDAEGGLLDSSEGSGPMSYLHGHSQIIPGLERALAGLQPGDSRTVTVPPEDAYGHHDPARIFSISRDQLPGPLSPGEVVHARQPSGHVLALTIVSADDKTVTLDANHQLAGKTLTFEVTVRNVEAATEQELAHGHAH